jgi:cytochrome d ubiquinol oxidase subunit II
MSTADLVAGVLWFGVTLYVVFGGADFGAGFWALVAGQSDRGRRARGLIDSSLEPVWEANHVWLIFCLVVLWTAFSVAFGSIMSTLFVPLCLAAIGIVFRGAGFAFHHIASKQRGRQWAEWLFGLSSLLTPFFMGTVVGAIAGGRVPIGNAEGDPLTSWLNPLSIVIGLLFVATNAYLSAAFLITDAQHQNDDQLEKYFALRAIAAGGVAGVLAIVSLVVLHNEAHYIYDRLTHEGLPLVLVSIACGSAFLVLLLRGARKWLRPLAIAAVVAVIWGWGVGQYPYLLPEKLSIADAAGPNGTLYSVLVVFVIAGVTVIPSLGLLFWLSQKSLLKGEDEG